MIVAVFEAFPIFFLLVVVVVHGGFVVFVVGVFVASGFAGAFVWDGFAVFVEEYAVFVTDNFGAL